MLGAVLCQRFTSSSFFYWRSWGPGHQVGGPGSSSHCPASSSRHLLLSADWTCLWGHSSPASLWLWLAQIENFLCDRQFTYVIWNPPTTDLTQIFLLSPFHSYGNWSAMINFLPARPWQNPDSVPGPFHHRAGFLNHGTVVSHTAGVVRFVHQCVTQVLSGISFWMPIYPLLGILQLLNRTFWFQQLIGTNTFYFLPYLPEWTPPSTCLWV